VPGKAECYSLEGLGSIRFSPAMASKSRSKEQMPSTPCTNATAACSPSLAIRCLFIQDYARDVHDFPGDGQDHWEERSRQVEQTTPVRPAVERAVPMQDLLKHLSV
jgi:hypothetical protein